MAADSFDAYNTEWRFGDNFCDDGSSKPFEKPLLSKDEFCASFQLKSVEALGNDMVIRLASRLFNTFCLASSPRHARNVRRSRQVLRAIRSFTEPGVADRCFSYLRQVDPLVFEEVVLSALEDAGALVLRNRRYSGDGGIDGVVWIATHGWIAVQVKRYSGHIELQHVMDFAQAIRQGKFDGELLVHTGRSGEGTRTAVHSRRITLLSGERLLALVLKRQLTSWRAR